MPSAKLLLKVSSKIKGHHVYQYKYQIGESVKCVVDSENQMSSNAIVVLGQDSKTIGHLPEQLAKKIHPYLIDGVITEISGTISGDERNAAEGKWVQGGGIELPCLLKLYGQKCKKQIIKDVLKR